MDTIPFDYFDPPRKLEPTANDDANLVRTVNSAWSVWKPPPKLTVSEWADQFRKLSSESSSIPGTWSTARAPYQREIMDCLSPDSPVERIVIRSSAQIGKTEILNNAIGYIIDRDPGPILTVQPTTDLAKAWSKDRLAPMVRDTPVLRDKVKDARSRDSENTILHKKFPGGHITMVGANAPSGLASRPIRYILLDEVDRYPQSAGTEGDPVSLAIKRASTFYNRKILISSTPTIAGHSRVDSEYELSDQREFYVPCPHCAELQTLIWPQVKFKQVGLPAIDAIYQCAYCEKHIENWQKAKMLTGGEWRAKYSDRRVVGFYINELYSPWKSWGETATEFLEAKDNPNRLRTWINTALGEPYEERGDSPDYEKLLLRREPFELGVIPEGALVLTGMADIQKNRIEWAIYGWAENLKCWLVDFGVIYGDTEADDAVWKELNEVTKATYRASDGRPWDISAFGVDSGFLSNRVYQFCRGRVTVFATKGQTGTASRGQHLPIIGRPTSQDVDWKGRTIKNGVLLWPIGTFSAKVWVYGTLRSMLEGTEQTIHFPECCDAQFFEQMTAEYLASIERRTGEHDREWRVLQNRPNEQLDLLVGNRAMAEKLGLAKMKPDGWERLRSQRAPIPETVGIPIRSVPVQHRERVHRSPWMG